MVRKDAGFLKTQRVEKIAKLIVENFPDGDISYEQLLGLIQFTEGLTRKTAAEYVDLVLQAKGWIFTERLIVADRPAES